MATSVINHNIQPKNTSVSHYVGNTTGQTEISNGSISNKSSYLTNNIHQSANMLAITPFNQKQVYD